MENSESKSARYLRGILVLLSINVAVNLLTLLSEKFYLTPESILQIVMFAVIFSGIGFLFSSLGSV